MTDTRTSRDSALRADPIERARTNWIDAGWTDSADGMALVTSVMRVQQVLLNTVDDQLRPFGLTFARFEVLMLLRFSSRGELPLGKIGERLQVHPASITNAASRLDSAGLIRRTTNPHDARSVIASITPDGRDVVERAAVRMNEALFSNLPLTTADQHAGFEVLQRWRRAFGDFT